MQLAILTAFGVGGATILGVLIGFLFQKVPHEFNDVILGYAAGIMLGAAVLGLIVPSLDEGNVWITLIGILCGAIFLNFADKVTPHLQHITGMDQEAYSDKQKFAGGTMLYVISDEMIPETHSHGYERQATYSLILGFMTMIYMDYYIG